MGRIALLLVSALAALACQSAPPKQVELPRENGDVCENLAYAFFVVAEKRDRGASQAKQLRELREGMNNPFARRPDQTFERLSQVVSYVYAAEALSAGELEVRVLAHCTVSEQGHAVVRLPSLQPVSAGALAEPDRQAR